VRSATSGRSCIYQARRLVVVRLAFGASNAKIFVTAQVNVVVWRNVAIYRIDVDIEIVVGKVSVVFLLFDFFKRHWLLRLQNWLRSPLVAAFDAFNWFILGQVIKTNATFRASALGSPFSLDHGGLKSFLNWLGKATHICESPSIGAAFATAMRRCQKLLWSLTWPRIIRKAQNIMHSALPRPGSFQSSGALRGTLKVPGDKSISHRALMLSALAVGESRISGLLEGEDVLATAAAMRAMGAHIERTGEGSWTVNGVGVGGLMQPSGALDMGNSGTSTRLLMGLVASHRLTATFIGDASLSKRPMGRVIDPLSQIGAEFTASPGGMLPLMVRGLVPAVPISYRLPVASAQVKSAVLLAGLNIAGITEVIEPVPTRDHSERMLRGFGADLTVHVDADGVRHIHLMGEAELKPQQIEVPGDPSSAAFFIVAALITPGSEVTVTHVGMNPTRTGIYKMLALMGADLTYSNQREVGGEPVADITARHSVLRGIEVPPDVAPSMIDEFPVFFIAASMAQGRTVTSGLDELRVKESDRLALMATGLKAIGAQVEERVDGLVIEGTGGEPLEGGATVSSALDHRIAMSFAVAGQHCYQPVTVDDVSPIATSFPTFEAILRNLQEQN
jgi:3-phosphoshikimate 1-carboxyvinyltransferase